MNKEIDGVVQYQVSFNEPHLLMLKYIDQIKTL